MIDARRGAKSSYESNGEGKKLQSILGPYIDPVIPYSINLKARYSDSKTHPNSLTMLVLL